MRKTLITALAFAALTATAVAGVQVTDREHAVCVPPAVINALS